MPRRAMPRAQAEGNPPAFAVAQDSHGASGDPGMCLQRRYGSGGVLRQVIDRRRSPCAGGLACAALVVGEHRHAGAGQVRPQRVEEPVVMPV